MKYNMELKYSNYVTFNHFHRIAVNNSGLDKDWKNALGNMDWNWQKKRFYRCKVKTSKKKLRSKIKSMKEWIKANRILPLEEIFKTVNMKLRGHYQYYGVTDNSKELKNYLAQTFPLLEPKNKNKSVL